MYEKQYDEQELKDVCDVLEADCPIYEMLLVDAAKMHINLIELEHKWSMLHWMLQQEGLTIEELKAFFERANLGTEPLEVLELSARRIAQSKGAKGGTTRRTKYQASDAAIVKAFLADPEAMAGRTHDHATHLFLKNHPEFDGRGVQGIKKLITAERKKLK